jgi:hypothetical protein
MTHIYTIQMMRNLALASVALVGIAACGGGAPTTENPPPNSVPRTGGTAYPSSAPPPSTSDVAAFRTNLWEEFHREGRCGQCHISQAPEFATLTDINLAYRIVLASEPGYTTPLVNFDNVSQSRLVTRVRAGHGCWESGDDAANVCGTLMEGWIRAWRASQGTTQINLQAPVIADPVASRNMPATANSGSPSFATTVYPLLQSYCADCHSPNSSTRQQPYLGSSNADQSYEAARPRMNLDTPALSRLVGRLRDESHNCWAVNGVTVDCVASANAMQAQITAFANGIASTPIPSEWVTSKALGMYGGTLATGGSRFDSNVIAKYEFKDSVTGRIAHDTSGRDPAMHLDLINVPNVGDVNWIGGWGLQFTGGKAQAQTVPSSKLRNLIGLTGEYSIEVWAAPANVVQDNARRIVSYAGSANDRNFSLGQTEYNYNALGRTGTTLNTPNDARSAQASLQHVVVTFSTEGGRRIYVNGEFTNAVDSVGASLGEWSDTFAFVLGNEVSNNLPWSGTLRFAAIHNSALTPDQVQQNFDVGVGEKYFVLFSVGHLIDMPESYVMFEVSQYDGYAYLVNQPKLISLDPDALPNDLIVRGMRIGVNGQEPTVGQAYSKLDITVANNMYTAFDGASLSTVGTIIPLERGPVEDQFFLTFEQIGDEENARTEPAPATPATPANVPRPSAIGVRTFDAINETFSQITGVSKNVTSVRNTYLTVKQALPAAETFQAFLASHQTALAQLAIAYCSAMVDNSGLRTTFYGGAVNMDSNLTSQTDRDAIIDPVVDRVMGTGLSTQPARDDMRIELNRLLTHNDATRTPGICQNQACGPGRTTLAMKAVCGAALASSVTTVQ